MSSVTHEILIIDLMDNGANLTRLSLLRVGAKPFILTTRISALVIKINGLEANLRGAFLEEN